MNENRRSEAVAWAQACVADRTAVVMDCETTGLGKDSEVIDIAIVATDGTLLFDSLVMPRGKLTAEAAKVNGLSREVLWQADAPSWREIAPTIAAILHGRRVVAFNAQFDMRLVNQSCQVARLAPMATGWECAKERFADLIEIKWQPDQAASSRRCSLATACDHFGIARGTHRALSDAEATRLVIGMMAEVSR